jgi:molecular chaperone HtpG
LVGEIVNETQKQFQIHLPGLLKVLAESLYSTKKVGIRELIQNAHDSCIRRRVESRNNDFQAQIHIRTIPSEHIITIQDNGSGLTEDEVTEYLSTIGRSYTRQLGEDLAILTPDEAGKLIGQFGLGFLSAFLIAQEVTLITRSYKPDAPAIRWRSEGDVHYNIAPVEDAPIGTRVELKVKPEASFLLNERVLIETVRTYADFLDIPVYVGDGRVPVNTMTPPWEESEPAEAMQDYITRTFGQQQALAIIPLQDQEISIGHDSITVPLQGFLFVPTGTVASIQEYGDVNIYIRRMFICERQTHLLPTWAKFVRGVIDCPYLQPTASREELQQDDYFFRVQKAIEEQLTRGLKRIAEETPNLWKQIVRGHRNVIMGWAVKDDFFFREVMDIVTFRTPDGQKNLPDYLKETDNSLYYITREMGSQQDQLLGAGYGVPVIDASWFAEPVFLQKYAHLHPQVKLVQMDGDAYHLMQSVPEREYISLLEYYRQHKIQARVVTFKPEVVPALMEYPRDAEFIRDTRSALDKGELPAPFAGLVGDYMDRMQITDETLAGTLYLNVSHALVAKLATMPAGTARDAVLDLIYQMAQLFAGRMLDATTAADAFRAASTALDKLLGE